MSPKAEQMAKDALEDIERARLELNRAREIQKAAESAINLAMAKLHTYFAMLQDA